uniref:tRNA(Phe) 7-[(3-amino-3-carboxypropyl)-4-demethylwyosine(37)-N(4)]-methyltransferase n=1 Tax=Trypanosoma congolense (strain IL3000) TaxID=1068625 RepID=F9WFD2_TRYCI|nr:unnamed protein product [Trypanosoma congolense IL3000]
MDNGCTYDHGTAAACVQIEGRSEIREKEERNTGAHDKKKRRKLPTKAARQAQSDKEFVAHKQRVLTNLRDNMCDHSPKGGVDRKCLNVMGLLNGHEDYITVSSCSGRIALFHSTAIPESKDGGTDSANRAGKRGSKEALGWLMVKHGELTGEEIECIVNGLCGMETEGNSDGGNSSVKLSAGTGGDEDELDGVWVRDGVLSPSPLPNFGTVTLKMEPFVMHVACRTMESGKRLLTAAATGAGFRNSGVTPPGKRVLCAIRHAVGVGLDVPLILDGVNYAHGQRQYVRRLLMLANEKMRNNDARRRRLELGVASCLEKEQDESN